MTVDKQIARYKYIHIWSSPEELKAICTDPPTLESIIRAIARAKKEGAFKDLKIKRIHDIQDEFHLLNISGMEDEKAYSRFAWWMFRELCEKGWEPMETSIRSYKLKYKEVIDQ